ncbi:hypothetical protein TNCV_1085001 [Trichonephila clavipes]|nr:hypothetical protein TNCV_1085001 [Trichonephila clavipes]
MPGNQAADELAGWGCDLSYPSSSVLIHSIIHSLYRIKMNLAWRTPPAHHRYAAKSSCLSLQCKSSRTYETALVRFRSGHLHLRVMIFAQGVKSFFTSPCFSCSSSGLLGHSTMTVV